MSTPFKPLESVSEPAWSEQRRLPRKSVLLNAILCDTNGVTLECVIQDIHAQGAAVSVGKRLRTGAQLYLLDISNQTAHLARVVWSNDDRSGLLFIQSFSMGLGLPPRLNFLWRLIFEAKLKQAERAISAGAAPDIALSSVGVNNEYLHRLARQAGSDPKFQQLIKLTKRLLDD